MRFVYAIIAFLLGLVLLGLGITQLTAEREETFTVETEGAQEAPFMVITDDVIDDEEGRDEFTIEAEGEYQIAQGRTYDVEAWLDDAAHNRITGYEASEDADVPSRFVAEFIDGETDVPDPSNSDLWVSVETAEGSAPYRWATPDEAGDWALLIFREDGEAAPSSITTTETVTRSAAEGIALTVGGALVILLSLVLFYRALSAPRRKQKKSATAAAAAAATSAETEKSESPKADAEASSEPSAGWSIPSFEAAAQADPDAPTEVVPAYADDEDESEAANEATEAEPQSAESEPAEAESAEDEATEEGERPESEGPVADLDQPTDVVPAHSDQEDSTETDSDESESSDPAAAGQDEDDTDEDQYGDDEQDDDEDDDSMTSPQADQSAESDPVKKVSRWTDRFRKRLDDGRSPFAVVLAMLVALASGFGLAGPAHADTDADSDEQDQAEESEDNADDDAADESGSEDEDSAAEDSEESDDADDEAAEGDEDADTSNEEEGSSEDDAANDDAAEDEDVLEGGLEDDGEEAAEPEVDGEMPSEGYSVLLTSQLESILEDIAETVAAGDEEQDSELLESRVDGPALALRELAYRNYDLAETEMPTPIGTEVLSAAVSGDPDFPRQAVVIVEHPDTDVPQFLVLEQTSARENYKLVNTAMMAPGTEFSAYSAEQGGISVLEPGEPDDDGSPAAYLHGIANWFADDEHEFGEQMAESVYIEALHEYHADLGEAAEDTDIEVPSPEVDDEQIFAIELPDGSRVVSGVFEMTLEMSPISDGDTIFLDNALVEGILGTDWTTFPTQIISQEYVVAQIPPEDSEEEIVLLGVDNLVTDANIDTPDWFDGY